MKFIGAAALALAGVAAAQNSTMPTNGTVVVSPYTTLTICNAQTVTITSCAATVTNCPLRAGQSTVVTTQYSSVYTTVCPAASASSVAANLPAGQAVYPAQTAAAAVAASAAPASPIPTVVNPAAGVAPAANGTATPVSPGATAATPKPYTGAASVVSGSFGLIAAGLLAAFAL